MDTEQEITICPRRECSLSSGVFSASKFFPDGTRYAKGPTHAWDPGYLMRHPALRLALEVAAEALPVINYYLSGKELTPQTVTVVGGSEKEK